MFSKKDQKPRRVGAKEKLASGRKFNLEKRLDRNGDFVKSTKGKGQEQSPVIPLTLIMTICVLFALFMTQGYLMESHGFRLTGERWLDKILIGPGVPEFFDIEDLDMGITIFIRALVMFLLGGVIPLLAYSYSHITDSNRSNVYIVHWGVICNLVFWGFVAYEWVIPAIKDILGL